MFQPKRDPPLHRKVTEEREYLMWMIDNICNLLGVTLQSSNDLEKIKVNQSATAVTNGYVS